MQNGNELSKISVKLLQNLSKVVKQTFLQETGLALYETPQTYFQ